MCWLCGHMVCCGATDARNAEAFGDNRRRAWALTATGGLMNEGSPWITSSEYFPSQRSWCVGVEATWLGALHDVASRTPCCCGSYIQCVCMRCMWAGTRWG